MAVNEAHRRIVWDTLMEISDQLRGPLASLRGSLTSEKAILWKYNNLDFLTLEFMLLKKANIHFHLSFINSYYTLTTDYPTRITKTFFNSHDKGTILYGCEGVHTVYRQNDLSRTDL